MKAIVQDRYGVPREVLRLADVDQPNIGDDEVLVRVRAASVHPDIWHVVRGWPYFLRLMGNGLRRPKQVPLGTDMAGVVEAVGRAVSRFRPGDEVFGETIRSHQWKNGGAYAEYVAVRERALELKPPNVTFEVAATVPTSGYIALQAVWGNELVQPGRRVLVNGAAGGVGSLALQIAKSYGATVTGVDSTAKLDLVRSLGADHVIDYTTQDFTSNGERYDLIVDIPGGRPWSELRRALAPEGRYVIIGHDGYGTANRWIGSMGSIVPLMARSLFTPQLRPLRRAGANADRLPFLKGLLEGGKLTPVVDRTFPLSEVPAAIRYLESGRARGKVVITL
jgi:NADPH:quinone reductase-like Zn-dependent oxidoreductase